MIRQYRIFLLNVPRIREPINFFFFIWEISDLSIGQASIQWDSRFTGFFEENKKMKRSEYLYFKIYHTDDTSGRISHNINDYPLKANISFPFLNLEENLKENEY